MPTNKVNLSNIGSGVAVEKFGVELQRVMRNIEDPNTEATAVREITLKFKFKPDNSRQIGGVSIESSCKLAGDSAASTVVYFGADKETGEVIALESDARQESLFSSMPNVEKISL